MEMIRSIDIVKSFPKIGIKYDGFIIHTIVKNDEITIFHAENKKLEYVKFNIFNPDNISTGYYPAKINNCMMRNIFADIKGKILYTNGDLIYKEYKNTLLEYDVDVLYGHISYIFVINNEIYIVTDGVYGGQFRIINCTTKRTFDIKVPNKHKNYYVWFNTNKKVYVYIIDGRTIYEVDIFADDPKVIKNKSYNYYNLIKISKCEFIYPKEEMLCIHNLENSSDEKYAIFHPKMIDTLKFKFTYNGEDYIYGFDHLYKISRVEYGYNDEKYKKNTIRFKGEENVEISLDVLRRRSTLYENMFSDLNVNTIDECILNSNINMSMYLKFIETGEYHKDIDSLLTLFKTCNYLEDIGTEYILFKLLHCENESKDIKKSVEVLHTVFRSPYILQYHNIRYVFFKKYNGKDIHDNIISYDKELYDDVCKYSLLMYKCV